MPNFLFPTYATQTLKKTLGNATLAAETSVETAKSVKYIASNTSELLTTANSATKALGSGYGLALAGAFAIDAIFEKNAYSRCMFSIGCGLAAVVSVNSAISAFNVSAGLSPVALLFSSTGSACYWLGRKANKLARAGDIPA